MTNSIWLFLRAVRLDFVDFDFDGTRAHAVRQHPDRQPIAYGFVFSKRAVVVFGDTDSSQPNRCTSSRI